MKKIGIIVGSTRPGRKSEAVADWVLAAAKQQEYASFELVDLAKVNLPLLNEAAHPAMSRYEHQHTKDWSKLIDGFDGFILVHPEYNHGYSAVLKNALDYLFKEWSGKPVAFVSYGGISGGLRAAEQLKQVVLELSMRPVHAQVSIPGIFSRVNEGRFKATEAEDKLLATVLGELGDSITI